MSNLTPYAAAKVVNQWIAEAGHDKVLPAQMFYNYTKGRISKGKAPFIPVDGDNKIREADLKAWFEKYSEKNLKVTETVEA